MSKQRIIAVQYQNSQIIDAEEFDSVTNALGVIEERNYNDRQVGYEPSWSVYLVEGSNWYLLQNLIHGGVRFDFMSFLRQFDGHWGRFTLSDFEAIDREDF